MSTSYAQKQSAAQKKESASAASVFDSSSQSESLQRKADMANNAAQRAEAPRPNNTGMPDNLKSGIECLSGFSMDDVRVHYNSSMPATVQALAYTQGTDIHVAPGQEKHLPHEAWHVAQQMAGRVSPTTNINGMPVNDNAALEHEADVMGEKAVQCKKEKSMFSNLKKKKVLDGIVQCSHIFLKTAERVEPTNIVASESSEKELPHIAFETLAGENRVGELGDLYNNVLYNYKGNASVYMGLNVCRCDFKQIGKHVWVFNDNDEENAKPKIEKCKEIVKKSITKKKTNHSITILPFTWSLVGLGTKEEKKLSDEEVNNLKTKGKEPERLSVGSGKGKNVYYYPDVKDYIFPFYEARNALMNESAKCADVSLYRWIDSDVRNDSSIQMMNDSEMGQIVDEIDSQENVVLSGFYEWKSVCDFPRIDDIKTNYGRYVLINRYKKIVELMNKYELLFRKFYFENKKGNLNANSSGQLDFYFPEPTLYMNKSSHDKAIKNLKPNGENAQSRESEVVLKSAKKGKLLVNDDFIVNKPLKKEFEEGSYSESLESIAGVRGTDAHKPIIDYQKFEEKIKNVRQTAFGCWGTGDDIIDGKRSQLLQEMFGRWLSYLMFAEKKENLDKLLGNQYQTFCEDERNLVPIQSSIKALTENEKNLAAKGMMADGKKIDDVMTALSIFSDEQKDFKASLAKEMLAEGQKLSDVVDKLGISAKIACESLSEDEKKLVAKGMMADGEIIDNVMTALSISSDGQKEFKVSLAKEMLAEGQELSDGKIIDDVMTALSISSDGQKEFKVSLAKEMLAGGQKLSDVATCLKIPVGALFGSVQGLGRDNNLNAENWDIDLAVDLLNNKKISIENIIRIERISSDKESEFKVSLAKKMLAEGHVLSDIAKKLKITEIEKQPVAKEMYAEGNTVMSIAECFSLSKDDFWKLYKWIKSSGDDATADKVTTEENVAEEKRLNDEKMEWTVSLLNEDKSLTIVFNSLNIRQSDEQNNFKEVLVKTLLSKGISDEKIKGYLNTDDGWLNIVKKKIANEMFEKRESMKNIANFLRLSTMEDLKKLYELRNTWIHGKTEARTEEEILNQEKIDHALSLLETIDDGIIKNILGGLGFEINKKDMNGKRLLKSMMLDGNFKSEKINAVANVLGFGKDVKALSKKTAMEMLDRGRNLQELKDRLGLSEEDCENILNDYFKCKKGEWRAV